MDYIITDNAWLEIGYLDEMTSLDVDIGDTNDFELILDRKYKDKMGICKGSCVFVPETEYGGTIEDFQSETQSDVVVCMGYTWRGLLDQLIIEPPDGQGYLSVSGDANKILKQVLNKGTGLFFSVPEEDSGIIIGKYQFRYVSALAGLSKMLEQSGARLDIKAIEGGENEPFRVIIQAVKVKDYSEELQYDGDDNINVITRDYRRGINHLICLGGGELAERTVLHLYVQLDGSISQKKYYRGTSERSAVYDYSSVQDEAELLKSGIERLKELMDYKEAKMSIDNANLEIGDIVSARNRDADIVLSRPVIQKILTYSGGKETIEHKLKGEQ